MKSLRFVSAEENKWNSQWHRNIAGPGAGLCKVSDFKHQASLQPQAFAGKQSLHFKDELLLGRGGRVLKLTSWVTICTEVKVNGRG
jgi:hypothetical protein